MSDPAIWIAIVAAFLTCCTSACNIALRTFSRSRLTEMMEERNATASLEAFLAQHTRLAIMTATVRVVLNFAILLAVFHLFQTQSQLTGLWVYAAAIGAAGAIVLVFGVAIPASWARYRAETLISLSIPTLLILQKLFFPLVAFLHLFDPVVRRISGAELESNGDSDATDEVLSVIEEHESEGTVEPEQREMIEAVFDLSKTTAGEIMTPRTDIEGIELSESIEQAVQKIMNFGHSRIPVYDQSIDSISGILYAKDLIRFVTEKDLSSVKLQSLLRHVELVPETKSVTDLLAEFREKKVHIAIVLDEYGGTAGLVTIEDILEELVGEIQDEYEPSEEEPQITRVDENTADVDARVYIDDLNDKLDLELPEDEDYDTVGGFVFSTLGHVPEVGESFEFEAARVTVTGAERTRVTRVRVERLVTAGEGEPSTD